ncbi:hypothetical protein ELI17_37365 [Rhizobium ruizarguesonis]|uniref:hypothetical protein n=1 Tax=Rhizobium ruizarguesonis TaxID=2081791 RepID=UPI001031C4BF|nr:hypothetical protein [Rhizobium ruizarguesonis]TAW39043.1 hypothetical protein ELI17_37365 [Rhizobium ruizarguesonis]
MKKTILSFAIAMIGASAIAGETNYTLKLDPATIEQIRGSETIVINGSKVTIEHKLPVGRSNNSFHSSGADASTVYSPPDRSGYRAAQPDAAIDVVGVLLSKRGEQSARIEAINRSKARAMELLAESDAEYAGVRVTYRTIKQSDSQFTASVFEVEALGGSSRSEVIFDVLGGNPAIKKETTGNNLYAIYIFDKNGEKEMIDRAEIEHLISLLDNPLSGDLLRTEMTNRRIQDSDYSIIKDRLKKETATARENNDANKAAQKEMELKKVREEQEKDRHERAERDAKADRMNEIAERAKKQQQTEAEQKELDDLYDEAKKRGNTAYVSQYAEDDANGPQYCNVCMPANIAIIRSSSFLGNYRFQIDGENEQIIRMYTYGDINAVNAITLSKDITAGDLNKGTLFRM